MKKQKLPTASKFTIVRQFCNYIPNHLVPKLARETGVDEKVRTFDEWSHVISLCYAQMTQSIGLNDVCDALQLNSGPLSAIRGATPPTRNNLSHANKVRDAGMAEKLFWAGTDQGRSQADLIKVADFDPDASGQALPQWNGRGRCRRICLTDHRLQPLHRIGLCGWHLGQAPLFAPSRYPRSQGLILDPRQRRELGAVQPTALKFLQELSRRSSPKTSELFCGTRKRLQGF
jgi:hypothetical protein